MGLGAILSQLQPIRNENGEIITDEFGNEKMKEVVISYASAGTDKHQRNYGATQLELLAM